MLQPSIIVASLIPTNNTFYRSCISMYKYVQWCFKNEFLYRNLSGLLPVIGYYKSVRAHNIFSKQNKINRSEVKTTTSSQVKKYDFSRRGYAKLIFSLILICWVRWWEIYARCQILHARSIIMYDSINACLQCSAINFQLTWSTRGLRGYNRRYQQKIWFN